MSKDYKDTTITTKADVPLPLKSAALPKSEETLHFCPSPYSFERNAYLKPHQNHTPVLLVKNNISISFLFSFPEKGKTKPQLHTSTGARTGGRRANTQV